MGLIHRAQWRRMVRAATATGPVQRRIWAGGLQRVGCSSGAEPQRATVTTDRRCSGGEGGEGSGVATPPGSGWMHQRSIRAGSGQKGEEDGWLSGCWLQQWAQRRGRLMAAGWLLSAVADSPPSHS